MKRLLITSVTGLLLSTSVAVADSNPHYISLGYVNSEIDYAGSDLSGSGIALNGSLALNSGLSLLGGYERIDYDSDLESKEYSFGAGYRFELASGFTLGAHYKHLKTELDSDRKTDSSANQLGGEVAFMLPDSVVSFGKKRTLQAYFNQTRYSNDDISEGGAAFRVYLTDSFSVGVSYSMDNDDRSDFQLFIREDG